jgi:DNA mismatch endonuclease (patch repair protein)
MTRSEVMARVRSKDTAPELFVRRAVHAAGFRFRLHQKSLSGCPDLVFSRMSVAVFVNGCFWHGHDCESGTLPKSNVEYWRTKISQNVARDRRNILALRRLGWRVVVLWSCRLESGTKRLLALLEERSQ